MHVNSCQGNFFSVLTKSIQVSVGKYQHSLFSEVKPSTWWSTNSFLEGACFFCVWSHFTFLAVDCPAVAKPKSAALLTFIQDLLTSLFRSSLPITRRDRKSPCKLQHKRKKWSKRDFNLQWNIFSLFHRKQGRFNHTLYLFVSRSYLLTSAKFNCKTKISKTAKCQQILRKVLGFVFFFCKRLKEMYGCSVSTEVIRQQRIPRGQWPCKCSRRKVSVTSHNEPRDRNP